MMNKSIMVGDERLSEYYIPDVELAPDAKPEWRFPKMDEFTMTVNLPEEFVKWLDETRKALGFDQ